MRGEVSVPAVRKTSFICTLHPRPACYNQRVTESFQAPIGGATRYCAVFGSPVRHSASPAFQNAGLAALGLDWRYLAFEVDPEDLRVAIAGAQAMNWVGLNLTLPHKLLAADLVDALDESARAWGAVNTIRFEALDASGAWQPLRSFSDTPPRVRRAHGFNTDADAIVRALREDLGVEVAGATVLLLGAGGAGRTAALKLAADGAAALFLVNRTRSKAEALAVEIRTRFPATRVEVGYPGHGADLVMNATSLGLRPEDPLPMDEQAFPLRECRAAYDMIYRPATTRWLARAQAAGCRTANGLGMLLYQGAAALELWTGQPAPLTVMRAALERNVYGT
ncbi:MAG: shikimate dehydrogenase [Verrucomicrobia bacterium]|nr:shikimate dehydrogenase [Verrucomicrobiota bacterium]